MSHSFPYRNKSLAARVGALCSGRAKMAEKKGKGSETAKKANAKAAKEGKSTPRKSSAAQSELGKNGARSKKK